MKVKIRTKSEKRGTDQSRYGYRRSRVPETVGSLRGLMLQGLESDLRVSKYRLTSGVVVGLRSVSLSDSDRTKKKWILSVTQWTFHRSRGGKVGVTFTGPCPGCGGRVSTHVRVG